MVKRVGDKKPEPKGGRAAERLAQFESARGGSPETRKTPTTRSGSVGGKAGGGKSDEGKKGRKD